MDSGVSVPDCFATEEKLLLFIRFKNAHTNQTKTQSNNKQNQQTNKQNLSPKFPSLGFVVNVMCHCVLWRLWLPWNSMLVCDVNYLIYPRAIMLSRDSSSTTHCMLHLNGLILFTAESIFTTLLLPAVVLIPVWTTEWYHELLKAFRP